MALYFFKHLAERCRYPRAMLDNNLAMDRNRIEYIARLPHGEALVNAALDSAHPIVIDDQIQLAGYRKTLEGIYGDKLKLRTHALVCIWLVRFVW